MLDVILEDFHSLDVVHNLLNVSILIVLDVILEAHAHKPAHGHLLVSILIVLDVILEGAIAYLVKNFLTRFNPYCVGCNLRSVRLKRLAS